MKIEEIRIPAPWGHIAVKAWGEPINEAIIVSHGLKDNAASFDRLIPLLPREFYYICFDIPGHGLSDHFPKSAPINFVNFLLGYKIVADFFKRSEYVFMGHSFGGILSILFAQLYPKIVSKLIMIDAIYTIPIKPTVFAPMIQAAHSVYFKNLQRNSKHRPSYTREEIIKLIKETKLWGDPINQPILVIHGVFDNAGAFDNLIPHLPENYYYICIDLPSHGKSSQFPPFLPIHMVDFLSPVRIVMDYFKRDKYIFMGHSLGGQIMMFYAQLYPEKITKIILLDSLYLLPLNEDIFLDFTKDAVDRVFKLLEQEKRPKQIYTYEEAVQKLIDGREHDNMSWEAAEPIARRMFEEVSEGKYVMNIDHRLKERLYPSGSFSFMAKVHQKRPVALPVLILLSSQRCLWDLFGPLYDQYVKIGYEIHKYEGHHDMHATNPEVLAPFIVKFLLKHSNKL